MKKSLVILALSTVLFACSDPVDDAREFELTKLKMQQEHAREMARIEANNTRVQQQLQQAAPQQVMYGDSDNPQPATASYSDGGYDGVQPASDGSSDSGISSTIMAVGAGALAGYAISELLDDGYRSYTDKSGKSVYVDKNGRQIDKRDYDAYKEKHPTKHKLSEYNQKGKQAVSTGAAKTVEAGKAAKTKTVEAAKKVNQKVVQPTKKAVQKKTSSFKSSSSKRR